ncbi:MAG: DUF2007 domain-containing protein [Burkholderiaceae bacterium]|nr:DUF2007 domain-containing protein [Burkholderiaceae bacterium]
MKLLCRCEHALQAQHLANALHAAGIACEVRNTVLAGALGEVPWLECAPQLWLRNGREEARARQVLAELQTPPPRPPWRCACGEIIEGQFGACWRCAAPGPP